MGCTDSERERNWMLISPLPLWQFAFLVTLQLPKDGHIFFVHLPVQKLHLREPVAALENKGPSVT